MVLRAPTMALLATLLGATPGKCQSDLSGSSPAANRRKPATAAEAAARPQLLLAAPAASAPVKVPEAEQKAFMMKSARTAWSFVSRSMSDVGFVGVLDTYPFSTVWDLASTFGAIHSARELGLITDTQYRRYLDRAFTTLEKLPLYDSGGYNKLYNAQNGAMVDRKTKPSTQGYGWSVLDHGRLLVWLKIVSQGDSVREARARRIVSRLDLGRMVKDGYLRGEDLDPETGKVRLYQEGRIGYEQYAAEGFALWGARAEQALDFNANAAPVQVNGQTVLADLRGGDDLTSEPFVMMGLEVGWHGPHWRPLALSILAAQEERFRQTGIVTMISEDAVPDPPAYFYYYLLYHQGKSFVVTAPGGDTSSTFPRWVSTKASFGYHALAPSDYTWRALQEVKYGAANGRGWTAGVYEGTKNATKQFNVNTAAIVLESAAYVMRGGCPLIQPACAAKQGKTARPANR